MAETTTVDLTIAQDGTVQGIYTDDLDYRALGDALGDLTIARASHVEPTPDGRWTADLTPSGGPVLGPFDRRREALEAELAWLRENLLGVAS